MEKFSVPLALSEWKPTATGEFPQQRARNATFDVFFDVILKEQLSTQSSADDLRRHGGHCGVIVISVHHSNP